MTFFMSRCLDGARAASLAALLSVSFAGTASAVEQLIIDFPVLETNLSLSLKGARTAGELIAANSDLQEFDRA